MCAPAACKCSNADVPDGCACARGATGATLPGMQESSIVTAAHRPSAGDAALFQLLLLGLFLLLL